VTTLDDLSSGHRDAVLCGDFVQGDMGDRAVLDAVLSQGFDAVMHFASFIQVGESVQQPAKYYQNNMVNTLTLLDAMRAHGVDRFIFSSTAATFGEPRYSPIDERHPQQPINPYGRTKLMCEDILRDLQVADVRWQVAILRYFNPVGAHESGLIGEHPTGTPNNLMPYITQVAVGQREFLSIFGDDYPTPDGTGKRDYIHVVDLAQGHLAALNYLQTHQASITVNLGTGKGVSVKELADTFTRVTGVPVPYRFVARRPGDVAACYADTRLAQEALGWKAQLGVERMCADAWRWQSMNPHGFS
jgi:UDP-glucose 4-epimerase